MADTTNQPCNHEYVISDGFNVCLHCGLCEDQVMVGEDIPMEQSDWNFTGHHFLADTANVDKSMKALVSREEAKMCKGDEDYDLLKSMCHNAGLPLQYADNAIKVFYDIKKDIEQGKKKKPRSFKPILWACLYYILQSEKSSFTLREICGYCEVPSNVIASAYNRYVQKLVSLRPSHIAPRFCAKLNLSKEIVKKIEFTIKCFEAWESCSLNPASVCGGIIWHHVRKDKAPIKLKTICEVVGVSPISICRFMKRYS